MRERHSSMTTSKAARFLAVVAMLAVACGGTYHPEVPDAARYVEVDEIPGGSGTSVDPDQVGPDGSNPTTGPSAVGPGSGGQQNTTGEQNPSSGDPTEDPTDGGGTLSAAGFPVASFGARRPANASGSILLGIVGPHTGPIALQGLASLRGVQATIAHYNANGGIRGVPIELLVEDDQFDPSQGRRFAQRMINEDQIFAMMGMLTPASFAQSLPDFEASGTLMMIGDGAASTGGSRLVFPSYQECPTAQAAATEYAIRDLGLRKIAILEIDIEVSRSCADAIAATADAMGADIVYRTGVTPGGVGCGSQAQGAADSGAETVVLQAETLTMIRCIDALRQAGFDGPVGLSANAVDDDALIDALGDRAEGIYSTSGFLPKWHPTTRAFCTDIIDTYYPDSGATQYLGYAACVGTRVLLDALRVLGPDATAREVIGYLERGVSYDTQGMGPPMLWRPTSHEPYRDMIAMEIHNGRWEPMTDSFEPVFGS